MRQTRSRSNPFTCIVACLPVLAGCTGGESLAGSASAEGTLSAKATLGKALFFDAALSASGRQSCGTCHVPALAFTGDPTTDQGLPVPLGGPAMDLPGFRNTPSLMYASFTPPFSVAADGTPTGGMFRDGRSSSLAEQAQLPFLTSFEMANANAAEVVARLRASPASLAPFMAIYGSAALDDPQAALKDIGQAIAAFETDDASFHPFSSKFDAWRTGKATLTAQELRGFALFNNPAKGNCTACHPSQVQQYAQEPLFTDFTYDNIGVPRNWSIPANHAEPTSPVDGAALTYVPTQANVPPGSEYAYYDMGLCGPFAPSSADSQARPDFRPVTVECGRFKVPTLRNVAVTAPYFHNGVFSTLQQVVEFYVTRDINNNTSNNPSPYAAGNPYAAAGTFYVAADGTPDRDEYNDLPVAFDVNVNIGEVPYTPPTFAGGQSPTLSASEIQDVVAFLCTLTDGYDAANPSAYANPVQCRNAQDGQQAGDAAAKSIASLR